MLHIGRNILSLVISRILAGLILFLVYTRLAQYLGPEAAGQFGLLSGFLAVFSLFVDLGMHQLVVKKVSENKSESDKYLNNYFTVQFIMGFAFMFIMAGFVYFADYPSLVKNSLYITALGLLLASLSMPFRSIINAHQKMGIIARVNFYNSVINVGFMIAAILLSKNIFFLAFVSVAVGLFDILVYWYYTQKNFAKFRLEFDRVFIRKMVVLTLPFTLLTFFSIYNRIDTLMLPHLRSFEETGYYAAAYKFWDVLAFFPAVIGLSLYPYFAEAISRNLIDKARVSLETYTRYMIAVGVPLSVGAFALAHPMTVAFYGQEFEPASDVMWLLVLAAAVLFIYSPVNSLIISQQTKAATKITGFTLLFNFTGNLIFIPRYGIVAAGVITVCSELIQLIGYTYIIKKKVLNFHFLRNFTKPVIAAAIMYLVLHFLDEKLGIWVLIAVGGLVYAAGLLIMKFFHVQDFELFKAAINIRRQLPPEEAEII
jgi:O-antigen/teichoic acid export membrane protein